MSQLLVGDAAGALAIVTAVGGLPLGLLVASDAVAVAALPAAAAYSATWCGLHITVE